MSVYEFVQALLDDWAAAEEALVMERGSSVDEANVQAAIAARRAEWEALRRVTA